MNLGEVAEQARAPRSRRQNAPRLDGVFCANIELERRVASSATRSTATRMHHAACCGTSAEVST